MSSQDVSRNIDDGTFKFSQLEKFGLKEDPFVDSSDDRFLFLGEQNLPIYKASLQAVNRRRGLVLVVGEPGAGKTILAKRLFAVLSSHPGYVAGYIPTPRWDSKFAAVQQISQAFKDLNVPAKRSYESQLNALETSIVDVYEQKKNVVLLVDDAQEIKPSVLPLIHELYNFSATEKTVQQIFFGQVETTDVLRKNPAVWSRVFQTLSLMRLPFNGTVGLVNFRVTVAGRKEPLFDDDAFRLLEEYAQGRPRVIVAVCSLALDLLFDSGDTFVNEKIMSRAIEQRRKVD